MASYWYSTGTVLSCCALRCLVVQLLRAKLAHRGWGTSAGCGYTAAVPAHEPRVVAHAFSRAHFAISCAWRWSARNCPPGASSEPCSSLSLPASRCSIAR